ncbi:hypothetical protein TCAL_12263 [Tigriopus californicus]|uniref:E3 ubiquitin-protein ligase n=1 Tax=Tigriopus californicus TaxID=6832 RepID=A0A553N8J2_TIGCA|nr:E3 ubiquitin-protein ligase NEDD4-like [Tigriopus californicus]XP_059090051.1 E3 ubiquitin-protein ligase NEDD4-like [Tigriopus californicus]TRY61766.1 hypothetical protein TCAL_12263 [Tigriopus californicus]|eukprot:TCALIF_12263-PA protein Name:"Similar to Nedd4 E3 ubiquitin-protein ligase NEDD4 (Mus musculus)" AED:0.08 eAED:0.08 QI:0/-1/0/1/-1/1/1/0/844
MAESRIVGYVPPIGSTDRTKLLRLKVIAGKGLAKKDIFGASDPYLRIDLVTVDGEEVEDSVLTKTKKRTLNPKWEEEFIFRVKPNAHKLVLEVFDENRLTRDDFLGMVELPLTNIARESEGRSISTKHYLLRPRSSRSKVKGDLELYHAFVAEENGSDESETTVEELEGGANGPEDWEIIGNAERPVDTSVRGHEELPAPIRGSNDGADSTAGLILPSGWEERQDANGRTYYVNHVARSTQWQHPALGDRSATTGAGSEANAADQSQQRVHISMDDQRPPPDNVRARSGSDALIEHVHNLSIGGGGSSDTPDGPNGPPSSNTTTSPSPAASGGAIRRRTSVPSASSPSLSGSGNSNPHLNTEGLPPDWTMQVAPNGRVFFINHTEKKTTWVDPRTGRPSSVPSQGNMPNRPHEDDLGPLPEGWEERVHTDARIFFIDHNTKNTQWEDPRISTIGGPAIPYNRDYKRKYDYLKSQLKKPSNVPNKFEIKVRRQFILEDSYRHLVQVPANKVDVLKTKLWIEFDNEIGLDYGGLAREWFYLLSKEMFNPYYGLFEYSATDNYTLQINPYSGMCNEDHISYFKFIGRIAGMAVYHGKLLDGFFIRPFYKMMLGKTITLKDMESVDTEYHNSLLWIKENDPAELELTFQVDEEQFGTTISRDLKPNGDKIPVTNENKQEYIKDVIQWRFVSRVEDQMNAFKSGFNELVSLSLLKIFDEGELELLMCGIGSIDVKDWKTNTVYKGDYHPNHIVIQWFWRVVLSFNNEMRSRLLQFVTGTSRVPMNGFKELYGSNGPQLFTIEKWGNPNSFPRAHTCFNRLDLPPYESYQQLRDRLIKAIEGSEGFAGVD